MVSCAGHGTLQRQFRKVEPEEECYKWSARLVLYQLRNLLTSSLLALTQEFVEEAVRLLLTRFLPLNPRDLNNWSTDPEEWMIMEDKDSEQWEYELRVRSPFLKLCAIFIFYTYSHAEKECS